MGIFTKFFAPTFIPENKQIIPMGTPFIAEDKAVIVPEKNGLIETEAKALTGEVLGLSEAFGSFLILGQNEAATAASALNLYRRSTAVSVPINRIAQAIADMKFVLEFEGGEVVNKHPILDLLRNPSPYFSATHFIETLAKNYLITNEACIVAIGGISRPPLELQPISPDHLTVPEGQEGLPTSHIITGNSMMGIYPAERELGRVRYIRDVFTESYLIRGFSTRSNSLLRGESLLASASSEVREDILGGEHNISLLEKGGRLSLVFNFKKDMFGDDFKTMKQNIRSQYGGANKAGQIGVTTGDVDIKELGLNNKDMEFSMLQKMARIAVANQYAFPLVLLDTDAATLNNIKIAKELLTDDAALPVARRLMVGISQFLMPRFGLDPRKYKLVPDMDSIQALATRRNEELKTRREIGIETVNELRAFIPNRGDVEGGNSVLVPGNLIPIENSGKELTDDNPPAFPKPEPEKEPDK